MKLGDKVRWPWGSGTATGTVRETSDHKVSRRLKSAEITRSGSPGGPALHIGREDGDGVLRLTSEVERA